MDADIAHRHMSTTPGSELRQAAGDEAPQRDRRLATQARRGSQPAIHALVDRHWASAYRVAYAVLGDSQLSEDVAQDALLKAIESLPRFDPRRPFAPWLHRIAANRAIDVARKSSREEVRDHLDPGDPRPSQAGLSPDLTSALLGLEPQVRAMFVLRHLFDYNSKELAQMLDRPAGTIRRQLAEARDLLEACLGER